MRGVVFAIVAVIFLFFTFIAGVGCGLLISGDNTLSSGDKVAVLKVEDVILDDQTYLDSITAIKNDSQIKAVVLRIESPGGAVGPSQELYSELKQLREKKPVVASIGNVGASGGYYIACAAEKIYANPGSITGSIGVVAQFVSYEKLLAWAMVDVEVIKSGEFKDIGSPFREMTDADRQYIQELIDNVYTQFKDAVGESRGLDAAQMDKVAEGKIYTGAQARELGLVDELGTINDAVDYVAESVGITGEPSLVYYPKKKSQLMELLQSKVEIPGVTSCQLKRALDFSTSSI